MVSLLPIGELGIGKPLEHWWQWAFIGIAASSALAGSISFLLVLFNIIKDWSKVIHCLEFVFFGRFLTCAAERTKIKVHTPAVKSISRIPREWCPSEHQRKTSTTGSVLWCIPWSIRKFSNTSRSRTFVKVGYLDSRSIASGSSRSDCECPPIQSTHKNRKTPPPGATYAQATAR